MLRQISRSISVAQNLVSKRITLPKVSKPVGNYVNILKAGNMLYLSGALPLKEDGSMYIGKVKNIIKCYAKVGVDVDEKTGYDAARRAAMVLAANIQMEVPDLDRIRIIKITGFVNCSSNFVKIPAVVNGASDVLVDIFGENGKHISRN